MPTYFADKVNLVGATPTRVAEAAPVDRLVQAVEVSTGIYVGFTETTVVYRLGESGSDIGTVFQFPLPADEELWAQSDGSGSLRILVTTIGR